MRKRWERVREMEKEIERERDWERWGEGGKWRERSERGIGEGIMAGLLSFCLQSKGTSASKKSICPDLWSSMRSNDFWVFVVVVVVSCFKSFTSFKAVNGDHFNCNVSFSRSLSQLSNLKIRFILTFALMHILYFTSYDHWKCLSSLCFNRLVLQLSYYVILLTVS